MKDRPPLVGGFLLPALQCHFKYLEFLATAIKPEVWSITKIKTTFFITCYSDLVILKYKEVDKFGILICPALFDQVIYERLTKAFTSPSGFTYQEPA